MTDYRLAQHRGIFDLLRHGETETKDIFRGRIDDPLSATGRQQMLAATAGRQWDVIVSSPLARCRLFAEDLAWQQGLTAQIEARLSEYDFGDWDGANVAAVMAANQQAVLDFFADPLNNTPPNAEAFADFQARVVAAWNDTVAQFRDRSVLIIAHGGVIMSVLAEVLGLQRMHGKIDVAYASMSRIRLGSDGVQHRLLSHGIG